MFDRSFALISWPDRFIEVSIYPSPHVFQAMQLSPIICRYVWVLLWALPFTQPSASLHQPSCPPLCSLLMFCLGSLIFFQSVLSLVHSCAKRTGDSSSKLPLVSWLELYSFLRLRATFQSNFLLKYSWFKMLCYLQLIKINEKNKIKCCVNFCCRAKWFHYTFLFPYISFIHILSICMFFFIFFFIMAYPRILNTVACAIQ